MKKDIVCYIAGPMRGQPDLGRAAFRRAEEKLRAFGWKVLNPAILPDDLPQETYMPICLAMVREADCVVLLDGWERSAGAKLEHDFAVAGGILCVTEDMIAEKDIEGKA